MTLPRSFGWNTSEEMFAFLASLGHFSFFLQDPTFITFYEKLSIAFNNTSCTVDDIAKALKEGPIEKVSMSDFSKVVKAFGDPSEEFFRLV